MKDIVTKRHCYQKTGPAEAVLDQDFFCRMDRRLFLVTKESKTQ